MATIQPIVSDVTIGNVSVLIDCVWIKCVQSFEFTFAMDEVPIVCDPRYGKVTTLRTNPNGNINIEALNLNWTTLRYALDAVKSVLTTSPTVDCVKIEGIQWTPEDVPTPTEWSATINLNNPNVDNVEVFTDEDCTIPWESATTPLNVVEVDECTGILTLTTGDFDEAVDTLYFSYEYLVDFPADAKIVRPPFNMFAEDHIVVAWHLNATTGEYYVYVFPRCQIVPNVTIRHSNAADPITVPIRFTIVADPDFNSDAPLGYVVISDTLPDIFADLV